MSNAKTVVQGLEALKNEHNSILGGLTAATLELTVSAVERAQAAVQTAEATVVAEKKGIVQKSLDMIELGLGEAQVSYIIQKISTVVTLRS